MSIKPKADQTRWTLVLTARRSRTEPLVATKMIRFAPVIRRAKLTPRIAAAGNVTESPSLLTIRGRPIRAVSRLSRLECRAIG
jgi:hypothetical protein